MNEDIYFRITNRSKDGVKISYDKNRHESISWDEFNKMFELHPEDKNKCKIKKEIYEEFSERINWLMTNAPVFVPKLIFHDEVKDLREVMGLAALNDKYLEKFKDDTPSDFINMLKQYKIIVKKSLERLGGEVITDNPTNIHKSSNKVVTSSTKDESKYSPFKDLKSKFRGK